MDQDHELSKNLEAIQYAQAYQDRRYYDQALWQIPSVVITVSSIVLAASFNFLKVSWMSGIVLLLGGLFDLTLAVVLTKHRVSIDVRTAFLEKFEKEHGLARLPFKTEDMVAYVTEHYRDTKGTSDSEAERKQKTNRWFRKMNAFEWTFCTIILLTSVLFLLGIYVMLAGTR